MSRGRRLLTAGATRCRTNHADLQGLARRDGVDADSSSFKDGDVPDDVVEEADDRALFGVDRKNDASGDRVEGLREVT